MRSTYGLMWPILILLLCASLGIVSMADGAPSALATNSLEVGDEAPDFELRDQHGETVKLSQFRGRKNVVMAFYPLSFTGG